MAIRCVTTCSTFVIITRTEYSFLSQQFAMSMRKRAGFLSLKRICELISDSESEGAGASSDTIIYLGNSILCIFRQPLKYPFYSFLEGVRKDNVKILDSPS
jgi:hypothetical protein